MALKKIVTILVTISLLQVYSQNDEKVLFTVDEAPVYASEFLRVYNKNLNIVADENQKDMRNYLDLFINYKLKVKEAYDLGLDTIKSYKSEYKTYSEQLIEPYLKDESIVVKLVNEAYQRGLEEILASHILIRNNSNNPVDTLKAYNTIIEARQKIVSGQSFSEIANVYSQDRKKGANSKIKNGGSLGYFSAFSMVYSFENAAYNTGIGEVSQPFKTKFGYHILQVNDRRKARGEVEAAHIMIKSASENGEERINEIYTKLNNDEDFGYLAKTQSDDTYSAKKNGSLGKFGSGRMIKEFEDVAFSLKDTGDISKPFKTKFGWHIIKLIKKFPLESLEEKKSELTQKIKSGDRSKIINSSVVNNLKKEYKIEVNTVSIGNYKTDNWKVKFNDFPNDIMTINGVVIHKDKLNKFLSNKRLDDILFNSFIDEMVLSYFKSHLHETNEEYANVLQEYKEGLLLFEVLEAKIWDKSKDSLGIQSYYDTNTNKYVLDKRFEGYIATCVDKKCAKAVRNKLLAGIEKDSIKSMVNSSSKGVNVIFKSGEFEVNDKTLPKKLKLVKGISKVYKDQNNYLVIKIDKVLQSEQQLLEDVRGNVVNDYQEFLEEKWVKDLHSKYSVKINDNVFKTINN
ncbi:MAG: peptidyl-prolyl cis-trans isomerase SurA [Flavobacteriales bacterium]|jgi:peptidyl-prolyl cis-trans isomerase SurA